MAWSGLEELIDKIMESLRYDKIKDFICACGLPDVEPFPPPKALKRLNLWRSRGS